MAERGMLGLFAGARGDRRRHLASAALASALAFALASALAAILTATSAPSPHLRPHPRRPTREGGPPASGWRLVTTRARDSECGSIVHALRASAQSRAQPRLQTQKRQSGL